MDQVDTALQNSWIAMLERIEHDPAELDRRRARAARICQRPVRPWCLAIRAGDTRIDEWGLSWSLNDDAQHGRPHAVIITQWDLVDLTAPIRLGPWPGIRAIEAARALGRSPSVIRSWIKRGILQSEFIDPRSINLPAGPQHPMVWSRAPLDPSAENGRPPHAVWGSLWQGLARDVPRDWNCTLQRVPIPMHTPRGGLSWRWVCPGRVAQGRATEVAGSDAPSLAQHDAAHPRPPHPAGDLGASHQNHPPGIIPCGRLCRNLYLPLPCLSIAHFRGEMEKLGIPIPPWADLTGQPPACANCWNIQAKRMRNTEGWNLFVSHVTGGMLTGSEVPRPAADAPFEKKKAAKPRASAAHIARRRDRIRTMLLEGHSYAEIQRELDIPRTILAWDAKQIYRAAGIPPENGARFALIRKFQWSGAAEVDEGALLGLQGRQAHLARLLVRGWSMKDIAAEFNIKHGSAQTAAHRLYKKLNVHSQTELRRRALGTPTVPGGLPAAPATPPEEAQPSGSVRPVA